MTTPRREDLDVPIPRVFHRIWLGGPPPRRFDAYAASWTRLNPGWMLRTWTDEDLPGLVNQDLFDSADTYQQRADIARYELIARFGGVYVDSDFECLKPIEPVIAGLRFFGARQGGPMLSNALFGATPEHPIMRALVDRLRANLIANARHPITMQTGPEYITRIVGEHGDPNDPTQRVFAPAFFYPVGPDGVEKFDLEHAIATHHWNGSGGWTPVPEHTKRRPWTGGPGDRVRTAAEVLSLRTQITRASARTRTREAAKERIRSIQNALEDKGLLARPITSVYLGEGRILVGIRDGRRLVTPANDLSLTPHLVTTGTYEADLQQFLTEVLRPGDLAIDVGANIGLFTTKMADLVGVEGRVIAYECNPKILPFLADNVTMNRQSDRVEIVERAAHRADGKLQFAAPRSLLMLGSTVVDGDIGSADVIEVAAERIDGHLGVEDHVRVVKIHVQGAEVDVLSGMSRLVEDRRVDYVVLELARDRQEHCWDEIVELFEDYADRLGAVFGVIGPRRTFEQLPLDEVLLVGDYANLVVDLTGGK